MILPLEILQNVLMGLRPIAKLAQKFHSTGINADSEKACKVFDFYSRFVPVEGKDILEIGPGHTLEVLEEAINAGAKSGTAVDVIEYLSPLRVEKTLLTYRIYDGKKLPFGSERFDLIWSHTAFEHLRYPVITVEECFRVLKRGGKMVCLIDLGDHSFHGTGVVDPLKQFDCLRYPEWLWNLMRWNRSSYVNRLRQSAWLDLFERAGFVLRAKETSLREDVIPLLSALPYLQGYSYEDAVTSTLTVCCEKL